MVVSFRDYEEGDVYRLDLREGDTLGVVLQDHPFPAWTMMDGDEVIACMGVLDAGGGVGNLWMYVTDKARGHAIPLFRFCQSALRRLFDVMRFHRIQTVIRTDRPEYERWAQMFCFEKEGLLRKATSAQEDLYLFARVV